MAVRKLFKPEKRLPVRTVEIRGVLGLLPTLPAPMCFPTPAENTPGQSSYGDWQLLPSCQGRRQLTYLEQWEMPVLSGGVSGGDNPEAGEQGAPVTL